MCTNKLYAFSEGLQYAKFETNERLPGAFSIFLIMLSKYFVSLVFSYNTRDINTLPPLGTLSSCNFFSSESKPLYFFNQGRNIAKSISYCKNYAK